MPTKKPIKKSTPDTPQALAMRNALTKAALPLPISAARTTVEQALTPFASALRGPIKPADLAEVSEALANIETVIGDYRQVARARVLELLVEHGQVVTDKGTKRATVDGWVFEARPTKTGHDARKLEALIRAKGANPAQYMETVITYKVDENKIHSMLSDGVMTKDELDTCKPVEGWSVQTPKQEVEED